MLIPQAGSRKHPWMAGYSRPETYYCDAIRIDVLGAQAERCPQIVRMLTLLATLPETFSCRAHKCESRSSQAPRCDGYARRGDRGRR
jgi:hypothetical protein